MTTFVRGHLVQVADEMKRRHGRERPTLYLEPGDLVLLSGKSYNTKTGYHKVAPKYSGPYPVVRKIQDNTYELSGLPPEVPSTQNVKFLKEFHPSPSQFPGRPTPDHAAPIRIGDHYEWEVAEIMGYRVGVGEISYRIKWVNYPRDSWLRLTQLQNCQQLLWEYQLRHRIPLTYWSDQQESSSDESDSETEVPDNKSITLKTGEDCSKENPEVQQENTERSPER